jgi:drug/metabolite transporter (DMT)-like permease
VAAAIVAGLAFGASGALAKPVLLSGWSPGAAVTVRALLGAAVLAPFALRALRGRWPVLRTAWRRVVLMGIVGVAGTQLAYFAAVERIPVATAALLEYLAPVALVAWAWAHGRRAPSREVLVGSAVAVAGLLLVIGPGAVSGTVDLIGLSFGLLAMTGCAAYFLIAARVGDGLPPVVLAAAALLLGGVLLGALGAARVLPLHAGWGPVEVAGRSVPVLVPLVALGVVATALAYATSIAATELLGSRVASFFGLLEVVAATGYAWLLLAEPLRPVQVIGGAAILLGIALVRRDRRTGPSSIEPPVPAAVPLGP